MTRALLPGRWNRDGRATPLRGCTGDYNQGRACTCDTELANDVPLDATRAFPAPPADAEPAAGHTLGWTILAAALIAAGLLMLVAPMPAHSEAFTVLVGRS